MFSFFLSFFLFFFNTIQLFNLCMSYIIFVFGKLLKQLISMHMLLTSCFISFLFFFFFAYIVSFLIETIYIYNNNDCKMYIKLLLFLLLLLQLYSFFYSYCCNKLPLVINIYFFEKF